MKLFESVIRCRRAGVARPGAARPAAPGGEGTTLARLAVLALLALQALPSPPTGAAQGPIQPVRMCAEWEPAFGTLIRWPLGIPGALVAELAEDDSVYVLVETAGQESQARATFASYGVNLNHVRFIRANTYSHWTRDWGPHSVFDGQGVYGITDPIFNGYPWVSGCFLEPGAGPLPAVASARSGLRGYEEDDAVNAVLAAEFGCPLHEMPAYCTGGNIMCDGHGIAFSTRRMVNENAALWTEAQSRQLAREYLGIQDYHILDDPEVHGIQHIDCYAKLLDEETVIVKQVVPGHPEYACIERLVDQISARVNCYGRPYRIVRVFSGSYSGNSVAAYTNSLILNRKVLVPLFGIASDGPALQVYRDAMPGYEVIGVYSGAWYYYDALHCRTIGIFDRHMLRIWHRRMEAEVALAPDYRIAALIDDRSEAGLIPEELALWWRRAGEPEWGRAPLLESAGVDSFVAVIPWQVPGTTVEYYLAAADHSGRFETLPRTAPAGCYSFTIVSGPADAAPAASIPAGLRLKIAPQVTCDRALITLDLARSSLARLTVHDPAGREIVRLFEGRLGYGAGEFVWNGRDAVGRPCPGGIYLVHARTADGAAAGGRLLLVR